MNRILTLLSEPTLRAFTDQKLWTDQTIYQAAAAAAAASPEAEAVVEAGRVVTYAELLAAADRLAGALAAAGLSAGDRVAVWLPSCAEVAVAMLACSRRGLVLCPSLHRDHTVAEVAALVRRMRARAVIAQPGYGADGDRHNIFDEIAQDDFVRATFAVDLPAADAPFAGIDEHDELPAFADPNTVVYLAFTSGTTGEPKGVMHSDNTLLAPTRPLIDDWSLSSASNIYTLSPLSHNLGFGAMLLSVTLGARLVIHDLPRGGSVLDRMRETAATFAFGVPTHAIDLLSEMRARPDTSLETLKGFRISGASVPPSVVEGLLEFGVTPQSGYGMTEAGSHNYTLPDTPVDKIAGSSGRPCHGYELKIFSQEDADVEVAPGEIGQIGGRGASLMLGYFDAQLETESSFNRSGWFLTGDMGWRDEDGYLHITGRKKDLIIRGGHNIYPAKIENLALRHAAVVRAAAIPIPDERLGEKVGLIVQLAPGASLENDDMLGHLFTSGLSKYDMPEYLGHTASMPTTPSGKVLKREVISQVEAGTIAVQPVRFTQKSPSVTAPTGG